MTETIYHVKVMMQLIYLVNVILIGQNFNVIAFKTRLLWLSGSQILTQMIHQRSLTARLTQLQKKIKLNFGI